MPTETSHRHLICRSLAVATGIVIALFLIAVFDNRPCVTISGGEIRPLDQYAGEEIEVMWHMVPHLRCEGEVRDAFRDRAGYLQVGQPRPTNYHLSAPAMEQDFMYTQQKLVPVGLDGPTVYEPIIQRWRNPIQKLLNRTTEIGMKITFNRLARAPLPANR